MSSKPLLDELTAELDLHLELDDDLSVFLPAGDLQWGGLRPGDHLVVDVHPLSLRLDPVASPGELRRPEDLPLARIDAEGRIHLPFAPPRLTSRRVLLQLRRRGACREIHLLADLR
jgi:hypothetical protein